MDIYTMKDWERDGLLNPEVGQIVSADIIEDLVNCLPPHKWTNDIFQPGEAHTHDRNTGEALYQTFEYVNQEGDCRYVGLRP